MLARDQFPEYVAVKCRSNGHAMRPMPGAYDETHDCERCTARAYPMPAHRTEWIGWAIEYTCDDVIALVGEEKQENA